VVLTGALAQDQGKPPKATTTTTTTTTINGKVGLSVFIDGKVVDFKNAPPQVLTGVTMVPLRGIFEALGAYVEYDEVNHRIHARKDNESIDLLLGSRIAKKNGAEIMMEVKPQVIHGTTMVPLRFVSESLGAKVDFDHANNRINVTLGDGTPGGSDGGTTGGR